MSVEYCRDKKNIGGRPRQEILKIGICTWNKKNKFFPSAYKIVQRSTQDYNEKIHFCKSNGYF